MKYEGFTVMGSVTIGDEGMVHRTDMPAQWTNSLKPRLEISVLSRVGIRGVSGKSSRHGTHARPECSSGITRRTTSTTYCRCRTGRLSPKTRGSTSAMATGIMYESEMNDCDELAVLGCGRSSCGIHPSTPPRPLHDFVFGYYKESAQPLWNLQLTMWDYWEKWHAIPHKCGVGSGNPLLNNLQCSYAPDGPLFTPEFMTRMRSDFTDAERLAKDDEIRARVKRAEALAAVPGAEPGPGLLHRVRRLRLWHEHTPVACRQADAAADAGRVRCPLQTVRDHAAGDRREHREDRGQAAVVHRLGDCGAAPRVPAG